MRRLWNEWMFNGERRKTSLELICAWIKKAWDSVDMNVIQRGFKKCCISNAMDGSEDDVLWEEEVREKDDARNEEEDEGDEDDIVNDAMYEEEDKEEDQNIPAVLLESDSDSEFDGF